MSENVFWRQYGSDYGQMFPCGIYLSGGIDSSAIAGMVKHLVQETSTQVGNDTSSDASRIECFTVQFDKGSGADESGLFELDRI